MMTPSTNSSNVFHADHRRVARLQTLARWLDTAFSIPGTRARFGMDSLIGMIPGIGDAATAALSGFIIYEAWRLGASKPLLARMVGNVAIDFVIGSIPFIGDLFDFAYKANVRNLQLLGIQVGGDSAGKASKPTRRRVPNLVAEPASV